MTVSSSPITYDPTNSKESNFPEALAAIIAKAAGGQYLHVVATSPRSFEDPAATARNQFAAALSPHKNISVETVRSDEISKAQTPDLSVCFSRRTQEMLMFTVATHDLPPLCLGLEETVLHLHEDQLKEQVNHLKKQANDFTLDR